MDFKLPSLNKVFVVGNLLEDPETKVVSSNNTYVINFRIACNKRFRDSQGIKDKVNYINLVAWSKLAETCSKVLKKGDGVFVEGELQNRQLPTGPIMEVLANRVEFLTKRSYTSESEEIQNDEQQV